LIYFRIIEKQLRRATATKTKHWRHYFCTITNQKRKKMDNLSIIIHKIVLSVLLIGIAVAAQAQIVMSGTVKTEKGVNMVGAYITVDSTNIATLSDLDGKFSLTIPEQYASNTITISYAGYIPETVFATEGDFMIILRDRETQSIDEIQVSTQKRIQRLMDVPIALSIIDSTKIRRLNTKIYLQLTTFCTIFAL